MNTSRQNSVTGLLRSPEFLPGEMSAGSDFPRGGGLPELAALSSRKQG
jgi:hypothetical protein